MSKQIIGYAFDNNLYSEKQCKCLLNQRCIEFKRYVLKNKNNKIYHCFILNEQTDAIDLNEIGVYNILEK